MWAMAERASGAAPSVARTSTRVPNQDKPLSRDEANALIAMIMRIDANLEMLLRLLKDEDGGEAEEEPDA